MMGLGGEIAWLLTVAAFIFFGLVRPRFRFTIVKEKLDLVDLLRCVVDYS